MKFKWADLLTFMILLNAEDFGSSNMSTKDTRGKHLGRIEP